VQLLLWLKKQHASRLGHHVVAQRSDMADLDLNDIVLDNALADVVPYLESTPFHKIYPPPLYGTFP
jgi:hypothetical protein